MANIPNITSGILDSIIPVFGQKRANIPVYNRAQRLFICDEHESASGNRYYKGIHFSTRLAIVENTGLYHSFTFIDGIEVYVFNGKERVLIGKKEYEKSYYDAEMIKRDAENMVMDYIKSQSKLTNTLIPEDLVEQTAKDFVDEAYADLLSENCNIETILPLLESSNSNIK